MKESIIIFYDVIMYLSVILGALGLFFFKKLEAALKIFVIYLVISASSELLSFVFAKVYKNNIFFVHIYTILELLILSWFFRFVFYKLDYKIPIKTITWIVFLLCVLNSLFIQPFDTFSTNTTTLVSLIVISYCVLTFYVLLDRNQEEFENVKWIVGVLLIYQMTSFIVLLSANLVYSLTDDGGAILWLTRGIITLITKLGFGYILFKAYLSSKLKLT